MGSAPGSAWKGQELTGARGAKTGHLSVPPQTRLPSRPSPLDSPSHDTQALLRRKQPGGGGDDSSGEEDRTGADGAPPLYARGPPVFRRFRRRLSGLLAPAAAQDLGDAAFARRGGGEEEEEEEEGEEDEAAGLRGLQGRGAGLEAGFNRAAAPAPMAPQAHHT